MSPRCIGIKFWLTLLACASANFVLSFDAEGQNKTDKTGRGHDGRFKYEFNNYHALPNCGVIGDNGQSPWLRELKEGVEAAYRVRKNEFKGASQCSFEIKRSGELCEFQTPSSCFEVNYLAFLIARDLSTVEPLTGPLIEKNRVMINLDIRHAGYIRIIQTLVPLEIPRYDNKNSIRK